MKSIVLIGAVTANPALLICNKSTDCGISVGSAVFCCGITITGGNSAGATTTCILQSLDGKKEGSGANEKAYACKPNSPPAKPSERLACKKDPDCGLETGAAKKCCGSIKIGSGEPVKNCVLKSLGGETVKGIEEGSEEITYTCKGLSLGMSVICMVILC